MILTTFALATREPFERHVDFWPTEHYDDIHCWWHRPDLNAWIAHLYYAKGGKAVFNNAPVLLTAHDIKRLEQAIHSGTLYGIAHRDERAREDYSEEIREDLAFIEKAWILITDGYSVFCQSFWDQPGVTPH